MRAFFAITVGLMIIVASAVAASAADVEGKIQSIDAGERTITLDNGTKVWISDGMSTDNLKEGAEVKVSYEEKDGKNVATSVEAKQ